MQIIINAAGMGTRLGLGISKSLVDIAGKPLICHQVDALRSVFPKSKILLVVGYMAREVALAVRERKGIHFVFNPFYEEWGVVASVAAAVRSGHFNAVDTTLRLDGDLLIGDPYSVQRMCQSNTSRIAMQRKDRKGQTAVIKLVDGQFDSISMSKNYTGDNEWPCIDFYTPPTLTQMMTHEESFRMLSYFTLLNHCNRISLQTIHQPLVTPCEVFGVKEIDDGNDLEAVRDLVLRSPSILDYSNRLPKLSSHGNASSAGSELAVPEDQVANRRRCGLW